MKTETGQTISETDRGQYLTEANWLQHGLGWRQCVMRRYVNERQKEPFVSFIEKTTDKPKGELGEPLAYIKERLMRRRTVLVRDVIKEINNRRLALASKESDRPTI